MTTKSTVKTCSCVQCKAAKGKPGVQHAMKLEERAHRHRVNTSLRKLGADADVPVTYGHSRFG